jgi:hypothetical protein
MITQEALFETAVADTPREIPQAYQKLYSEYLGALKSKCSTIMWVVLERGREIKMMKKIEHRNIVEDMLRSGDTRKEKVAEEVMLRSTGNWRNR